MQVQVQVKGLSKAAGLRAFATCKLKATLSRYAHAVQDVTVRMSDINGPDRGGVDKLCRVVLRLSNSTVIVIEDIGVNMMEVIDRVASRVHHAVSKQLSHLNKVDRTGVRSHSLAVEAT
jgi:hypothetical protein